MSDIFLRGASNSEIGRLSISVSTVYCIGKNYADHAKEMQTFESKPVPSGHAPEPVVFSKPASSLIQSGESISIPAVNGKVISSSMHHEVELVVAVSEDAVNIAPADSGNVILGYAVGLDMTLRDRQSAAKAAGNPWLVSKGFRTAAVVSEFVPASEIEDAHALRLELRKNGAVVQSGDTGEMLTSVGEIISYLSQVFGLVRGDLIYTGTPAGVGAVVSGDRLEAALFHRTGAAITTLHTRVL